MNTKLLMIVSSLIMGIAGIILSFFPQEILNSIVVSDESMLYSLILQILGALYFSFSMVNWTAKANLIGGIYSRPVSIGNLVHFTIGSLALLKGYSHDQHLIIQLATLIYIVFAIFFGIVFFRHPISEKK